MGAIEDCQKKTTDSKIKVEELRRKAIFLNPERNVYLKTQIDDCVIKNAVAADWIVTKEGIGDIVVELKGKDVDHATKQILATMKFWKRRGFCRHKVAALIVCSEFPRASTRIQKAMQSFRDCFSRLLKNP